MSDLGQLSWFLGIEFRFEDGKIKMSQRHYLKKLLCKYKMEDCKPRAIPSEQKLSFSTDKEVQDVTKYREMVGSLVYAMTSTRPDLCWIVTKLSQYLAKPTIEHHVCVKHVLRYVKGTLGYELCFEKSGEWRMMSSEYMIRTSFIVLSGVYISHVGGLRVERERLYMYQSACYTLV